jgi:alkylhydroperoxidase/carboxymuconolactone decarboxylase family protein YurZ
MRESETHTEFLGMGLDLSTDAFTDEERERTLKWYSEVHDHGDLDLAPFSRFMLEHDPTGFKRLRRHLITLEDELDGPPLPVAAGVLMFVHTYIVLGMGKGALYEIIAMRELGASRAEVMEIVRLGALHGGPRGINALAEVADAYLREWKEEAGTESRVAWPAGWAPDVERFRSGIDLASDELEPGELELIRDWYRGLLGEVPPHVDFLARVAPRAFKTQRARFETAITGALPAQMIPLLSLHLSAVRVWPKPLRRAVQTAKALGVQRGEVVAALFWAGVYGADIVMETALDAAGDILEKWD